MTQNNGPDLNDPFGAWRTFRDANLDAWAKGMSSIVNTDAFAKAIGLQLDSYLAASAPFQKAVEQYMEAYLAQLHMPSRVEVISLAERMTHVEMRLDDLDARLDEILAAVKGAQPAALPAPSDPSERLSHLEQRLDRVLDLLQRETPPSKARPARRAADAPTNPEEAA